jgi:aspartyl-tRNA(Asn)/glutamyl-tRNA(Gln) amidotransferase subunit A
MEDLNKDIHAFLEIFKEPIKSADFSSIENNPLKGMTIAVKDNMCIEGVNATAGSKILEGYKAPYTATALQKLLDKGVSFVGRTNLDEFAMGSSTENSAFGSTKNPLDTSRVPGGSSGGSAAAVAAGLATAALGSDTGGSIRQPAAFCGIVGMKPTYGAVSRYGLIALGSSLDQIGPFTKTVTDAELIFNCMKGKDKYDATSFYPDEVSKEFKKIIGVPKGITNGLETDVKENFENALEKMKSLGYEIREIEMPNMSLSLAVYYIIQPAEASSNLARFDGIRYGLSIEGNSVLDEYLKTRQAGFGAEAKRRIILGTYVLSSGYHDEYYASALKAKEIIKKEFENAFMDVSAIATPTTPTPAFKFGEKTGDPVAMYLADVFTVPANIAGIPAISLPSGFVHREGKDLPLGFQLMAGNYKEHILFDMGKEFLGEALE